MLITITLVTLFLGSENDHISNAFINIFWDLLWRHGTQRIQSRNIWAKIENPAPAPTEPINMKHFWGMFQSKFLELVWSLVLFMFLSLVVLLVHVFLSQCHPPCFLWESIMSSVYVPQSCPYLPPCLVSLFGPQFPRLVFYSLSVMCIHVCSPQSVMALCPSLIRPLHLLSLSGSHVCPPHGPTVKPVSPSLCFRVLPILFWHFLILCSVCSVSLPLSPIRPSCVPHVFPFSLITLVCFYCMSFLLLLVGSSVRCSSCCRFFPYPGSVFHLF